MNDIDFRKATFLQGAPALASCPADGGAEVAFAGRSNAGKSSAINTLTGNSKLARTSKTPGRTRMINFFGLAEGLRLVDLPGYGYARVPKATKELWDRNLADYLRRRRSLRGLVLLMDARHPLQPYDRQMLSWAVEARMPIHLLLTKADKLKAGQAKGALRETGQYLKQAGLASQVSLQLFSSLKKSGLAELERKLITWLSIPAAEECDPIL